MYRHILNKRKPSCTYIPPRVNLQVLKKDLSKEAPWESYEKIHQKQFFEENNSNFKKRLMDRGHPRKPTIRNKGGKRNIAIRDTIPTLSFYYKGSFREKVWS